jgi:ketosteroid isomerase-like protein
MRIEWLIIAALSVTVAPSSIQAPQDEFIRLEESWNAAHRNGDAQALDNLWADELEVDVPRMPTMSKTEALAFARTGRMRFDRYETSDIKVWRYGETAVVTGRLLRTRTVDGKQHSDDWTFTKVYTRQAGAWRVVSFHASDSPPRQ